MKKISFLLSSTSLLALPMLASAQLATGNDAGQFQTFVENLTSFIAGVAIPFLMSLAFLAFVWGMFQFFIAGGADEEKREKGKSLMIYATLGFVMIVLLYGIVNFIDDSLGLDKTTIVVPDLPTAPSAP
jgi:hypothetical protein